MTWRLKAACRGHSNPELWFPLPGDRAGEAQRVCLSCVVRVECLSKALDRPPHQDHGVWGGLTESARQRIRGGPS